MGAQNDMTIVGCAASSFGAWNGRLALWHFYVDPSARQQGVGRRPIEVVEAHGMECGARDFQLETGSLNVPGAGVYGALGFSLPD
jgi:ribosomal protein S18 acetylase RimI-like enzyme